MTTVARFAWARLPGTPAWGIARFKPFGGSKVGVIAKAQNSVQKQATTSGQWSDLRYRPILPSEQITIDQPNKLARIYYEREIKEMITDIELQLVALGALRTRRTVTTTPISN